MISRCTDHGWQLGEWVQRLLAPRAPFDSPPAVVRHGLWDKQTEFELATRVPLLIKVPWAAASIGKRLDHFVELVVSCNACSPSYLCLAHHPTTSLLRFAGSSCNACRPGWAAPDGPNGTAPGDRGQAVAIVCVNLHAAGEALQECVLLAVASLHEGGQPELHGLHRPSVLARSPRFDGVVSAAAPFASSAEAQRKRLHSSIRVADWRLTVWLPFNNTVFVAEWDAAPIAVELYDHRTAQVVLDFDDDGEHENVASDQANADVIATLTAQLRAEYSYDRNWLVQRMAKMAAGQANQATRDGYVDRPAPTSPDAFAAHA